MLAIDKQTRINEQIRIPQVRVIASDGTQLGVIATEQALTIAREQDLDLVEVAPTERPPVCRIMDFGKFKYQQKKKSHKQHTHHTKIKEIRVRPKTGDHDIETKVNQAKGFLRTKIKWLCPSSSAAGNWRISKKATGCSSGCWNFSTKTANRNRRHPSRASGSFARLCRNDSRCGLAPLPSRHATG